MRKQGKGAWRPDGRGLWTRAAGRHWLGLLALPALACFGDASAEGTKEPWEEYSKIVSAAREISPHGPDLFGDDINLQNGALSFRVTDVSLPGNNALPVAITRTLSTRTRSGAGRGAPISDFNALDAPLGDWDLELPRVGGVFPLSTGWVNASVARADRRCSVANPDQARARTVSVNQVSFQPEEIWHGTRIAIPGRGQKALLVRHATSPQPTGGGAYWITSDFTTVACPTGLNAKNTTGEGFLATTADGITYRFDWMAASLETSLTKKKMTAPPTWVTLPRRQFALYATRAEDRFGNWVEYTYDNAANAPVRLRSIVSNDQRRIDLEYVAGTSRVWKVRANGREWIYGYENESLASVRLPDHTSWSISARTLQNMASNYRQSTGDVNWRTCTDPGEFMEESYTATMTHPSGAVGTFVLEPERFVRHGIDNSTNCSQGQDPFSENDDEALYPVAWDSYAVASKTISGPAMTTATWRYEYFRGDWTAVTGPGDFARYTFGNTFRVDQDKLLRVERGSGPDGILSVEDTGYELGTSSQPWPTPLATSPQVREGFDDQYPRPLKSSTIQRQGRAFSMTVSQFDHRARPLVVTRSSNLAGNPSRTEATTYHDNDARWVLGQVASVSCTAPAACAGSPMAQTTYDANWATPVEVREFGEVRHSLTYDTGSPAGDSQRGTLKTVTDGAGRVTSLSSWKRGIPGTVRYPETPESPGGATRAAAIDDNGWITGTTDENSYTTGYRHDDLGRVNRVIQPTGDSVAWADTLLVLERVSGGFGLAESHWRQTTTTGKATRVVHLDGFMRPVVEETYDADNAGDTRSIVVTRYDAAGRKVFVSYPMRTLANWQDQALRGTAFTYDALDRPLLTRQWSEAGELVTAVSYTDGFTRTTRNPRQFNTIEYFQAWDVPGFDLPVRIDAAEGVTTTIARDAFGKTLSISRSGPDG